MFSFLLATTQQWESHEYRRKFLFNQNFNQIQPLCQPFPQFPQQQYEQFPQQPAQLQQHEGQYQQLLQEFPLQPPNEQPTHQVEQYQPFLQPQQKQSQQQQQEQQQNELGIPILTLDSLNQLLQPNGNITEEQQQDFNLDDFLETTTSPNPTPHSMLI